MLVCKKRTKVGLELRQAWFFNSILLNMETWHNLKDNDLKEINKLDNFLLRKIVGAHSKVPVEFLFLETAALPIDIILKSRRINYLHTILNRERDELTHKIYLAQLNDPIKGDWAGMVEEDMKDIKLSLCPKETCTMKKAAFKNIVKNLVKIAAFDKLKEVQSTHTKINTIKYEQFKLQPYLDSNTLTVEERSLAFNVRANTLNGFKMCFTSMYRDNLNCKLGCDIEDSFEHCMSCDILDQILGSTQFKINDISNNCAELQKEAVKIFTLRKNKRAEILEQHGAYQGQIILDTSTPAVAGGAGEEEGGDPVNFFSLCE